ncbi:MAG TPA: LacI family DNA-binding transcriptional regulator [Rariglobus sp.]|nr:LacI family DNA-binding transcriptional regulator [Rariglobus sp.]
MQDIALKAGVSKNAVSLALRHDPQISSTTRAKIERIARELGYRKNPTVAHLMANLRSSRQQGFKATFALLNANTDERAFVRHPTVPAYVEGCRRRAAQLGYILDEFWLHDPQWKASRLLDVLHSRGIRGAIIVGAMDNRQLPVEFLPIYEQLPCIVTGHRTYNPSLSFACVDHHNLALQAFEQALALGYKRPALALDKVIDQITGGRFTAGFLIAQQQITVAHRTQPFFALEDARKDISHFHAWIEKEKPDVILTLYNVVKRWVESLDFKVPRDMGLIQLEWRRQQPEWAGMNQHNDIVGEAAVDMLVGMVHRGERGVPDFPRATLIGSTWNMGRTVRQQASVGSKQLRPVTR